jgi:outer membrane protein assembly factor BamB
MSPSLSLAWRHALGASSPGTHAPTPFGDIVFVRAGLEVRGLDLASGDERWRLPLDARDADGRFTELVGGLLVTELWRRDEDAFSLVAVTADGDIRWRVDLPPGPRIEAVVAHRGTVWICARTDGAWRVHAVDAATGRREQEPDAEAGALLTVDDGGRVIGVSMPREGAPALYRREHSGAVVPCPDRSPGVWSLARDGATLVTAERARSDRSYLLHGRQLATLASVWSAPSTGAVAACGGVTAFTTGDPSAPVPVLVDTATGAERWRGRMLPSEVASVLVAPPVVAFSHDDGTTLFDLDGRVVAETELELRALRTVDDSLYASIAGGVLRYRLTPP